MTIEIVLPHVYLVSSNGPGDPIAICPRFRSEDNKDWTLSWEDTSRGVFLGHIHLPKGVTPKDLPKMPKFEFTTEQGYHIRLELLTKDLFRTFVAPRLMGEIDTSSDESIQKYYLETNFEQYS